MKNNSDSVRSWQVHSRSPEETARFAQQIGARLVPGDIVLLSGGVGAGKTHFARSLILSLLPVPEDVPSPTYTLVQIYEAQEFEIFHADLYRLGSADEAEELGLTEAFSSAVCLIEWPDRLGELLPPGALHLIFENPAGDDTRSITILAGDLRWTERLEGISDVRAR